LIQVNIGVAVGIGRGEIYPSGDRSALMRKPCNRWSLTMAIDIGDRARRWFTEMWANRDRGLIDAWMHPDCIGIAAGNLVSDRASWISQVFEPFTAAFPDLQIQVLGTFANGDEAMVRWRFFGTHCGEGLGMPPCGLPVSLAGMTWMRFHEGRIVEGEDCFDSTGLMRALQSGRSLGAVQVGPGLGPDSNAIHHGHS
jgi:predicted ester cyclase